MQEQPEGKPTAGYQSKCCSPEFVAAVVSGRARSCFPGMKSGALLHGVDDGYKRSEVEGDAPDQSQDPYGPDPARTASFEHDLEGMINERSPTAPASACSTCRRRSATSSAACKSMRFGSTVIALAVRSHQAPQPGEEDEAAAYLLHLDAKLIVRL